MASTTELRKSYLDTAKTLSTKPLYAWVGAGDLAVANLKEVPATFSKLKSEVSLSKLKSEVSLDKLKSVPAAQKQFVTDVPGKITAKVNSLPKTPKGIQAKLTEATEAQVKAVDAKFDELAERGESVVKRVRSQKSTTDFVAQAKTTVAKAKAVPTTAARTAAPAVKSTATAVKSTATAARKTAVKAAPAAKAPAVKVVDQA